MHKIQFHMLLLARMGKSDDEIFKNIYVFNYIILYTLEIYLLILYIERIKSDIVL